MEPEFLIIVLLVRVVTGVICAVIAQHKGRNVAGWFFGGLLLEIIGVIIVAVLPNLKAERNYRLQAEQANHRLREQLRQERMKTEAFRQYSMSRLDAHDKALGVDTRTEGPMLEGSAPPRQLTGGNPADALDRLARGEPRDPDPRAIPPVQGSQNIPPVQEPPVNPEAVEKIWFYAHGGNSYGPISKTGVAKLLSDRVLTPHSLLWTEGMVDWLPISDLPDFRNSGVL